MYFHYLNLMEYRSIPSPLINEEVEDKLVQAFQKAELEYLATEGS